MADNGLAPVRGKARIDVLDILRGIAILGIFYMNDPYMGQNVFLFEHDIRAIGWTAADQATWAVIDTAWEGTQRGLLEYLFGAGLMVLAAKAMTPDGPVAVADLYLRRNLWLLLFGLVDIFILLWPGDILHIYALAALFLFPFRTLAPRWLLAIGLAVALVPTVAGVVEYAARTTLIADVQMAKAHQAAGKALTKVEQKKLVEWRQKSEHKLSKEDKALADRDRAARSAGAGLAAYAQDLWGAWLYLAGKGSVLFGVIEAFGGMLIGIALWKWRIIQGGRSARFYALLAASAYSLGMGARAIGVAEVFTFSPIPKTIWITEEYARLAVSLGHLALINLLVKSRIGSLLLAPFKAAGRMAFSLYFIEQIIGIWVVFAPFGLGLYGRFGWAELAGIATLVVALLLILANLWMRYFAMGPLEWLWRSLSYLKRQPFRHPPRTLGSDAPASTA